MATLTIRDLSPKIVRALKARAKRSGRSMEQEVREMIGAHVGDRSSAIKQIEKAWAKQERIPKAKEIDAWLREGRP